MSIADLLAGMPGAEGLGVGLGLEPEPASVQNPSVPSWADLVQDGNPAAVGIVNPELAMDLTEEDILNQIQTAQTESQNARNLRDNDWWLWEDLYRLRSVNLDKQQWQANLVVGELRHKIHTLRSLMQSALIDPERFFAIIKESSLFPDEQIRFIESWMYLTLRHANFRQALLDVLEEAFLFGTGWMRTSILNRQEMKPGIATVQVYSDPQQAMAAAMAGMQTMREVVALRPEVTSHIDCRVRHVRSMFPDPLCRFGAPEMRYVIERFECDREEVEELHRLGVYDSIDDIGEGMRDSEDHYRTERWDRSQSQRKRDTVQEYTGNLYKDGELACRNWVVTVVNQRAITRIGPAPLWTGKSRYTCAVPLPRQDDPWGESLIEADAVVEHEMKSLLDLMVDDVKFSVLGAFMVDESRSAEPEPITGIEPGRVYAGDGPFLQKLSFPSQANGAWPLLTHLQGIGDKTTMVNEFAAGSPSSRGRPTATEVQSKTQSSTGHIHNVARSLEEEFLEPTLTLIYEYLLQFGSDLTPELNELAQTVGGVGQLTDPVQRFKLLDVPFRFQVRGISMLANRESLQQRIMQVMQMGQQMGMPPVDQVKPFYTLISSMGFAPEQLGYSASPEQYQQYQQQQQMQQMQQQQQEQGGAPAQPPPQQAGPPVGGGGSLPAPPALPSALGSPGGPAPTPDQQMNLARSRVPIV